METPAFGANAASMNAIATALGGIVFALTRQLDPARRLALARDLARQAQARNVVGDTTAGTLLLDVAGTAEAAADS